MSRRVTGTIVPKDTKRGRVFGLRFTAYGERRYLTLEDGSSREDAERELRGVLSEVERGVWQPPAPTPVPVEDADDDPGFHEFASQWFADSEGEWRAGTVADYRGQLVKHLLPFFRDHTLSQITVAEVDRYRQTKVAEGKLSNTTINKHLTRLGQILEVAVERELIERNPATVGGKRRRLKAKRPRRAYLDRAEQITELLSAAVQLDAEARATAKIHRHAILATLVFAGLRISELVALDWGDVDLAAGRLRVRESKTDAGVRYVNLLPVLASELRALKAGARNTKPTSPVFPSAVGTRSDRNRIAKRVLGHPARTVKGKEKAGTGAVGRANKQLEARGLSALPVGLTCHALRRTFASTLVATGSDPAYVMAQMGHTSPTMTLGVYAQAVSESDRARLRALIDGEELAPIGTDTDSATAEPELADVATEPIAA
jgi:integrase